MQPREQVASCSVFLFRQRTKAENRNDGTTSMSSADPTDVFPAATVTSKTRPSKMGSRQAYEQATEEAADVRSERPQAKPEDRITDPPEPKADPVQETGPKGIRGAFQKHPVAMIVCLGLIAVGIIAGIAWYLHARHYESTDDAFIDGRPVLVSPQVTGNIIVPRDRFSDLPASPVAART
jgi:membrane fusion protein (multidrug efflux system)